MRHRKTGRKLGRSSAHRKAMFSNMVTSLFEHESIRTTDARAKELRRVAERLITAAKHGVEAEVQATEAVDEFDKQRLRARGIHARRRIGRVVRDRYVLQKLFGDIAPRFSQRPGGYTRIVKLGHRYGDAAPISLIELIPGEADVVDETDEDVVEGEE